MFKKSSIKHLACVIFMTVSSLSAFAGAPVERLTVDFVRTVVTDADSERTEGTIYFDVKGFTLAEVVSPVTQWMKLSGNHTVIYYPVEKEAFDIESNNAANLPFAQALIACTQDDYGLGRAGFTLANTRLADDTLELTWAAPKELQKVMGNIVLTLADNKVTIIETFDAKKRLIGRTEYNDYADFDGHAFPQRIVARQYQEKKTVIETIFYSNIRVNPEFPAAVREFSIPDSIKVTKVKW
jgi:hypothetical protein